MPTAKMAEEHPHGPCPAASVRRAWEEDATVLPGGADAEHPGWVRTALRPHQPPRMAARRRPGRLRPLPRPPSAGAGRDGPPAQLRPGEGVYRPVDVGWS